MQRDHYLVWTLCQSDYHRCKGESYVRRPQDTRHRGFPTHLNPSNQHRSTDLDRFPRDRTREAALLRIIASRSRSARTWDDGVQIGRVGRRRSSFVDHLRHAQQSSDFSPRLATVTAVSAISRSPEGTSIYFKFRSGTHVDHCRDSKRSHSIQSNKRPIATVQRSCADRSRRPN